MSEHRSAYRKHMKGKQKNLSSFKVMENNDYNIILIEDFPCKSKDQLFARERYYTNTIECVNIRKNQGCILEIGKKNIINYIGVYIAMIRNMIKSYTMKNIIIKILIK